MDTFTPSDMPEADVHNLRYHIIQSIVRHFMEESHYEGLVHPRIRPLLEKSEEVGAVLYDHNYETFPWWWGGINRSWQTVDSQAERRRYICDVLRVGTRYPNDCDTEILSDTELP